MNLNGSVFWFFSISLRYTSRLARARSSLPANLSPVCSISQAASSYFPSATKRSTALATSLSDTKYIYIYVVNFVSAVLKKHTRRKHFGFPAGLKEKFRICGDNG